MLSDWYVRAHLPISGSGYTEETISGGSGSQVVITLDTGGRIDFQMNEYSFTFTDPSPPVASSWYISLRGDKEATWNFVEPCI